MTQQDSFQEKKHLSTESSSKGHRKPKVSIPFEKTLSDMRDLKEGWDLTQFEKNLIDWTDSQFFGQTEYQNKYFVVNSQVTPWRQMRQAVMEIQTRLNAVQKVTIQYKRTLNDIERTKSEMAEEENKFYKQDKEYELELLYIDLQVWDNKMRQSKMEIDGLLRIIKEKLGKKPDEDYDFEELKETVLNKEIEEKEEHKYWIARMAKQSALDLLTTGRLQAGNLDSMLMMSPEDQAAVTDLALTYSTAMNINIGKLKEAAEKKVEHLMNPEQKPQMFDTTGILTDYAHNNVTERTLQSADKPEDKS
tara:strand:- start:2018 stop:2932 length:915 start_codon:yes stop_codon:yes gene_type:complete